MTQTDPHQPTASPPGAEAFPDGSTRTAGSVQDSPAAPRDDYLLIDVRTPLEFSQVRVPGSVNVPLDQLDARIAAIAPDLAQPLVLFCKSGVRSAHGCQYLAQLGYTDLSNGGTVEWVAQQLGVPLES